MDSELPSSVHPKADGPLDLRGYRCPAPVIRLEAALRKMGVGQQVIVITDDPVAVIDIPYFCSEAGHALYRQPDSGGACVFQVTRAAKPAPD